MEIQQGYLAWFLRADLVSILLLGSPDGPFKGYRFSPLSDVL